jgi:hypothetical protein
LPSLIGHFVYGALRACDLKIIWTAVIGMHGPLARLGHDVFSKKKFFKWHTWAKGIKYFALKYFIN